MKLKELETIVMKHLEESGEIRSDLKWLKKSYWAVVGAVIVEILVKLWVR